MYLLYPVSNFHYVQATAFEEQLPPKLLAALLPDLPAGVKVYSPAQLLEFLKEISSISINQSLVFSLLFFRIGNAGRYGTFTVEEYLRYI